MSTACYYHSEDTELPHHSKGSVTLLPVSNPQPQRQPLFWPLLLKIDYLPFSCKMESSSIVLFCVWLLLPNIMSMNVSPAVCSMVFFLVSLLLFYFIRFLILQGCKASSLQIQFCPHPQSRSWHSLWAPLLPTVTCRFCQRANAAFRHQVHYFVRAAGPGTSG